MATASVPVVDHKFPDWYFVEMTRLRYISVALFLSLTACTANSSARMGEAHGAASHPSGTLPGRQPQTVAFAGKAHQVAVETRIDGKPATFLIDTGVDPSALDVAVARAHGLSRTGEEAFIDGVGKDATTAYPTVLDAITIGDRQYGPVEMLAFDMSKLSARYGSPLAGILGYSLLKDHAVLIDYPSREITLFAGPATQEPSDCEKIFRFPLRFLASDDRLILVPGLTIGDSEIPAFIDTGSSNGLRIDLDAPSVAEINALLPQGRESTSIGARGADTQHLAMLSIPVELGPFTLENAEVAMVHGASMPIGIGNRFFEALNAKLLVDIPGGKVAIFQACK